VRPFFDLLYLNTTLSRLGAAQYNRGEEYSKRGYRGLVQNHLFSAPVVIDYP